MLDLGEIREKIDGIDKQLVSLFEERMALCHSVAVYIPLLNDKVPFSSGI